jgi:hypothetical protein
MFFLHLLKEVVSLISNYHSIRKCLMSFPLVEKELLGSWEGQQGGDRDDTIPNSISLFVCWRKTLKKASSKS